MTTLIKELWERRPPQPEHAATLGGLFEDFQTRHKEGSITFELREFAENSKTLFDAIRAIATRDERPCLTTRMDAIFKIGTDGHFGDLMELLADALPTVRLGRRFELAAALTFFIGGPRVDAIYPTGRRARALRALGLPDTRPVRRDELPVTLIAREMLDINDFLRFYVNEIEGLALNGRG